MEAHATQGLWRKAYMEGLTAVDSWDRTPQAMLSEEPKVVGENCLYHWRNE